MEKWFSIFLPRFGFVSKGRQTWAVESIVLVYGTTHRSAIGDVDHRFQPTCLCSIANPHLCDSNRVLVPHDSAHHESATTRVADLRGDCGHCDPTTIWIMES